MDKSSHYGSGNFTEGEPPPPDAGLFGMDPDEKDSTVILIPVAWDATTSYGRGTAGGPAGIVQASHQLDLEDLSFGQPYKAGLKMGEELQGISALNEEATRLVEHLRASGPDTEAVARVNSLSRQVNRLTEQRAADILDQGKIAAVVGGDHSSPYGAIKALAEKQEFGILHIDAHFDLRNAYEGFEHSHASIMYNVLNDLPQVKKLVQTGIRDFCSAEAEEAERQGDRVRVFYDQELFRHLALGNSFADWVKEVISCLPDKVWVSFDIDGLAAAYGPSTGTPEPGGLSYHQAMYLLEQLALSGKKIVGFDLCEVAPDKDGNEWDLNVGARVLYRLCGAALFSQGLINKSPG